MTGQVVLRVRRYRSMAAVVAAMLAASACSAPATDVVDPDPAAGDEPPPASAVAPLTGLDVDEPEVVERPVVAVKIDNAAAARPQLGLEAADVVFEELVEGGQTRFIALYQGQEPDEVGPVRSGREVDADLLPAFDPTLAMSGAAPPVWALLRAAQLRIFEEGQADGAFRRDSSRRAPHNLMVSPARLWAAADGAPASQPWPIDDEVSETGDETAAAELRFSPQTVVTWSWDGDGWVRTHDGVPHLDADGAQLRADNVIVARVDVTPGDRFDSGGYQTVAIDVIGEGDALVLRGGRAIDARWVKSAAGDQFAWLDPLGDRLPVGVGRTWVELVPADGEVRVRADGGR